MIGRFWGVDAIGIYGRAYQLVNIPTDNLNSAVGEVAFSALSRLQDDPVRFRRYFLKGFSLVLGLTLPITIACALFADDVVFVLLGPKWKDAATIVRLLAPTIAIFAIINPLGWLIFSIGLVARGLKIAPVLAAMMIAGYAIALPYGPKGVAFAYSAVLTLWRYSAYLVVRTRYGDFRPGHSGGGEPAAGLRRRGWRASLWSATNLRPISFSFAPACSRKQRSSRRVLRGALVCRRTEITVF